MGEVKGKYRAFNGREYNCVILKEYDNYADLQIDDPTDNTFFVNVPNKFAGRSPYGYYEKLN